MEEKKPTTDEANIDTSTTEVSQMDGDIVMDESVATSTEMPKESAIKSCLKNNSKVVLMVIGLAIVATLAWVFYQQQVSETMDGGMAMEGAPSFEEVPDIVARVNGVELTKDDYIEVYQQSWQAAAQQGIDTTDPAMQTSIAVQTMDVLVNTELLTQAASAAGIVVTEEDMADEMSLLTTQMGGTEGLQTALAASGMDMSDLKESMNVQMQIEAYLTAAPEMADEVVISDAEVKARYDEVAALSQGELPAYDDVVDVIRAQLESEAQQESIGVILERLRSEADVEVTYTPAA